MPDMRGQIAMAPVLLTRACWWWWRIRVPAMAICIANDWKFYIVVWKFVRMNKTQVLYLLSRFATPLNSVL